MSARHNLNFLDGIARYKACAAKNTAYWLEWHRECRKQFALQEHGCYFCAQAVAYSNAGIFLLQVHIFAMSTGQGNCHSIHIPYEFYSERIRRQQQRQGNG
eukprot:4753796-Amphidinium_carterae.1